MNEEATLPKLEDMAEEQVEQLMTEAAVNKDYKAVRQYAAELDKREKTKAQAAKAELQKKLEELTSKTKAQFDKLAAKLRDSGELDGADGIWYVMDFGSTETGLKLVKSARTSTPGSPAGKSSYVADPRKSADMLAVVGDTVMFAEDTKVVIDKTDHIMPAGTTLKQAYDYSTNGGWRNRVRMAILKAVDKQ